MIHDSNLFEFVYDSTQIPNCFSSKAKTNRAEQMQITIHCFYKTPKMSPDSRTPGLERQVREGPQPAPRPDQGRRRRPEEQEEAEVEIGRIQVRGFIM